MAKVRQDEERGTWFYHFEHAGRIYKKRGFSTRKEAERAQSDLLRDLETAPVTGRIGRVRLDDAVRAYLADLPVESTRERYRTSLAHVLDFFPKADLGDLDLDAAEAFYKARKAAVTVATANRDVRTLSALCSWAMARPRRWLRVNPLAGIELDDEPRLVHGEITEAEFLRMRTHMAEHGRGQAAIDHPRQLDLAALLGVRIEVVLGLEWQRVSLEGETLVYTSKGKTISKYLDPRAAAILRTVGPLPTGYVFRVRSYQGFYHAFKRAAAAIDKPALRPHTLRVQFARERAASGTDPSTIMGEMGHSTLTMTLWYIGVSPAAQREAAQRHAEWKARKKAL